MIYYNEYLQVKMCRQRDILKDKLTYCSFHNGMFYICFVFVDVVVISVGGVYYLEEEVARGKDR